MKMYLMSAIISTAFFSLSQSKHSISLQSGIFHSYFDQTPLMNFNYTSKDQGIFHGVFLGSNGLNYSYGLNQRSNVSLEAIRLASNYQKYRYDYQMGDVAKRVLITFCIKYNRETAITEKTQFIYGAGVSYRKGFEEIHLGPTPWQYSSQINQFNLGLTTLLGLQHQLNKSFSIYSILDLRTILLNMDDKFKNPRLYSNYPSLFDLSLKLGFSFHF